MHRLDETDSLIQRMCSVMTTDVFAAGVIPWGSPVPSFGSYRKALVATVGLNPSNREFVDAAGTELRGKHRRFETLQSLGISSWAHAGSSEIRRIAESCEQYFQRNPYGTWFNRLDRLLGDHATYYPTLFGSACHLDICPFATWKKWGEISAADRGLLVKVGRQFLEEIMESSSISLLILNGQSVVRFFADQFEIELVRTEMEGWALTRGERPPIKGYAYDGAIECIGGPSAGRKIKVVGFNHNIQSTYGLTGGVVAAIQHHVSSLVEEVIHAA